MFVIAVAAARTGNRWTVRASRGTLQRYSEDAPSPHPIGPHRQNIPPLLARLVHVDRICAAGARGGCLPPDPMGACTAPHGAHPSLSPY
eukprot:2442206-Pyramimonas_sp.AAC.1